MFSIHAIHLPDHAGPNRLVFFGKGQHDEAAARARLRPEHEGASIFLGPAVETAAEVDLRYLILLDQLTADYGPNKGQWWRMPENRIAITVHAAMHSMAPRPDFPSSAEALTKWRHMLGLDQGTMAAMIGCERTRVHRLEQGKSKLTFEDYRALRHWAQRLDALPQFMTLFSLGPVAMPHDMPAIIEPAA